MLKTMIQLYILASPRIRSCPDHTNLVDALPLEISHFGRDDITILC